jgi:hypothetical protein
MNLVVPTPDEVRRRIAECEAELKALRRLLRTSQDAHDAEEARRLREAPQRPEGGPTHAA